MSVTTEGGAYLGALLLVGAILDYFVVNPLFKALTSGTSLVGWNPATAFMFFVVFPYVASVVIVAVVIGGIFGRS